MRKKHKPFHFQNFDRFAIEAALKRVNPDVDVNEAINRFERHVTRYLEEGGGEGLALAVWRWEQARRAVSAARKLFCSVEVLSETTVQSLDSYAPGWQADKKLRKLTNALVEAERLGLCDLLGSDVPSDAALRTLIRSCCRDWKLLTGQAIQAERKDPGLYWGADPRCRVVVETHPLFTVLDAIDVPIEIGSIDKLIAELVE